MQLTVTVAVGARAHAFNPRIGNPAVTILMIILIYVVAIAGAWYKLKRWGLF